MSTGKKLAQTAQMLAERPFHGRTEEQPSNLLPIVRLFPKWNLEQAERMWCAAFVYYCCIQAGFSIPYSPQECRSCNLAGCGGWEEFAQGDKRIAYYDGQQAIRDADFVWQEGDILLYDRVFINREHDHIGILLKLEEVLCELAGKHTDTVMPGYTHLQRAQPVTLGHHLMAYAQMFSRDLGRLDDTRKRMNESPLGCCALAGTTYSIDRYMTSDALGFDRPMINSLDGVSDRDFCVELNCAISLIMTHLSRFSEEIIMWCSWEFKFIELDDAYATGSSIMPQKKNPDITELIRGKAGRVNGNLMTLLSMLKGLPLAYNKDMQEDKEAVFDSVDNVKLCLKTFIPMLETMRVNKDKMRAAAAGGFINATDCADYLVKKGMPFRDAYKISGRLVAECIDKGLTLETLPLESYRELSGLFSEDIYDAISLETCVKERSSFGGPSPESVIRQIEITRERLGVYYE